MRPQDDPREGEAPVVASATECTGLVPALPQTEEEGENDAALYAVHKPKKPKKMFRIR